MVIADVSGKGVPAALFMVISKTLLKEQIMTRDRLDEAMTEVNRQLCASNGANMFVTVWAGVLEISSGRLIFVNGGHNPPLVRKNGAFEFLKNVPSLALAILPEIEYAQLEIILAGGDALFLYTDGVTEATDGSRGLYGNDMMLNILNSAGDVYPGELLPLVLDDILGFVKDTPQSDDITMLALRLHSGN
jgi:serine phosphatase RsbU (regulator of sigma subunit)